MTLVLLAPMSGWLGGLDEVPDAVFADRLMGDGVAIDPTGKSYCSGGEDGYVRVHHFDPPYFEFKFEVEREQRM